MTLIHRSKHRCKHSRHLVLTLAFKRVFIMLGGRILLLSVLLGLFLSLLDCAGKRLPVRSDETYFIPANKRYVYINECVNLTGDFDLGANLATVLRRYYTAGHSKMKYTGYTKADFILTVYLSTYEVKISTLLDTHGKSKLAAALQVQIDFIRQRSKQNPAPYYTAPSEKVAYLSRTPLLLTATSDEYPNQPSSTALIQRLLYVKLIKSLDFYFKTGSLPTTL